MVKIYEGKQANSPKLFGLAIGIIVTFIMLIIMGIVFLLLLNGNGLSEDEELASGIVIFSFPLVIGLVIGIAAMTINSTNQKIIKLYGKDGYIYFDDGVSVFRFHKENIINTKNIDYMRLVGRCEVFIRINHVEYKSFKTGEFIAVDKNLKLFIASGIKPKNKKEIVERIYEAERRSLL